MSFLRVFLETLAEKWIRAGETRIPVVVKGNVGWGAQGQLLANASTDKSVGLTVDFTDQMQTHTIQFDGPNSNVDVGLTAFSPNPVAEILWSVNGVVNRRLVDVMDGVSVSGMAQAVTVNVQDFTVNGNGAPYHIGLTVAPGLRANTQQPPPLRVNGVTSGGTAFFFGTSIVATDSATWIMPANAGIISTYIVLRLAAGEVEENVAIEFIAANASILMTADGSIRNRWVPVPQGTNTIKITNSTSNTISAYLTMGIDG